MTARYACHAKGDGSKKTRLAKRRGTRQHGTWGNGNVDRMTQRLSTKIDEFCCVALDLHRRFLATGKCDLSTFHRQCFDVGWRCACHRQDGSVVIDRVSLLCERMRTSRHHGSNQEKSSLGPTHHGSQRVRKSLLNQTIEFRESQTHSM